MSAVDQQHALTPALIAAYAARLDDLAPAPPPSPRLNAADAVLVDGVQPLIPTMAWNWRDAATGTTDRAQYDLLDTMPASADVRSQYVPSSSRFSSVYADIVQLIDAFPLPQRLSEVRRVLKRPQGAPADTANPVGWTKVPDGSGILRWQPDWSAAQTPRDWLDEIALDPQEPTTLRFEAKDVYGGAAPALPDLVAVADPGAGSGRRPVPLAAGELHAIEITAAAWGRVPIRPGQWFDPAIIALRDRTTYRNGLSAADLIGPDGMLRAQATGLLVAADPRVTLTVQDDFVRRNASVLRATTEVEVAGWVFCDEPGEQKPVVRISTECPDDFVTELTARSNGTVPQIAGLYVSAPGS